MLALRIMAQLNRSKRIQGSGFTFLRDQGGQGMVEFSLILVVLLGLFIGSFEIMTLYRQRTDLETAARMAARQASEIYLISGIDVQAEIEAYALQEMELMGYDAAELASDPNWEVEVTSFAYDGSGLSRDPAVERCLYGDYIAVRLRRSWSAAVLPLDTFFDAPSTGILETEYINKCWRGE